MPGAPAAPAAACLTALCLQSAIVSPVHLIASAFTHPSQKHFWRGFFCIFGPGKQLLTEAASANWWCLSSVSGQCPSAVVRGSSADCLHLQLGVEP